MDKAVIKINNLTKTYGNLTAVDHLDIVVEQGEIFGLLGPNGAGKSTTIECMLGIKKRNKGSVEILGMEPSTSNKKIYEQIGVQFQASHYPDKIKVWEMCELVSSLYSKSIDWKQIIKKFGLEDKTNQLVSDLSGGERQKLSVILALLHKPKVVFLDELTTGLDPVARREVWSFLKTLKEQGLTIFLTSHYMDEVHFLCDRVSIINHGKVIITGTPDSIIKHSNKSNLEEAYLELLTKGENYETIMGTI